MESNLYDNRAETIVVSTILSNPSDYWIINSVGLTVDDFLGVKNRRVFEAIEKVVATRRQPDLPWVIEQLPEEDHEFLDKLLGSTSSTEEAIELAALVKNLSGKRALANAGANIIKSSRMPDLDFRSALASAEKEISQVRGIVPIDDHSPDPVDILAKLDEEVAAGVPVLFSPSLQYYSLGLIPGCYWVIGGHTSVGKSAVAVNIAMDVLKSKGKWVGIISLEMPQKIYMIRILSYMTGIGQKKLLMKEPLTLDETDRLEKAKRLISLSNIKIFSPGNSMSKLVSAAKHMKETSGLDVLIVDFLQNILPDKSGMEEYSSARHNTIILQNLARDLDCTVVALSQVSNEEARIQEEDRSKGKVRGTYSFKGAGDIAHTADIGIILYREQFRNSPVLSIDVKKSRNFETGNILCHMDLPTGRIYEVGE